MSADILKFLCCSVEVVHKIIPHLIDQTNFIISAEILCANFNTFYDPSVFFYIYASLMFSNSLRIIKIDRKINNIDNQLDATITVY